MTRPLLRQLIFSALIMTLCTACAFQGSAGFIGIALSSSLLTLFLLLTGGTQSGCDPIVGPCLSPPISGYEYSGTEVGPCLSPPLSGEEFAGTEVAGAEVGPCLSPPLSGEEFAGTEVGPCLSPPLAGEVAGAEIGPCLSPPIGGDDLFDATPPFEDMGVSDMGASDMGDSDMGVEDMLAPIDPDEGMIGPCLSAPVSDMGAREIPRPEPDQKSTRRASERDHVIERLSERGGLPADVLKRIKQR